MRKGLPISAARGLKSSLISTIAALSCVYGSAQEKPSTPVVSKALTSFIARAQALAPCVQQAAAYHRVPQEILLAIGMHESGGRANIVMANTNSSIDVGAFGINSVHFERLKKEAIEPGHLLDPCISAYVAAWHYRSKINILGNTWAAVGAYHSATPSRSITYQNKIYSMHEKLSALNILYSKNEIK